MTHDEQLVEQALNFLSYTSQPASVALGIPEKQDVKDLKNAMTDQATSMADKAAYFVEWLKRTSGGSQVN